MARLVWDQAGARVYETGVDHGVLFVMGDTGYLPGVPWNGLTAVNESPSGAEASAFYADNIKYANIVSAESYAATIEAYTYPPEFSECDGSRELAPGITVGQQERKQFAFVYRTKIGNDTQGQDYGYKLNLVYGCLAAPSEKNHETVNESPEPNAFSWEISTSPVAVDGLKPTATLSISSLDTDPTDLAAIEAALFGDETGESELLLPDEVAALITTP